MSNWLRNYALGLTAGLAVALFTGYWLWFEASDLDRQIRLRTQQEAAQYADPARIGIECEASDVVSLGKVKCVDAEAEAANEAERNAYDLEAQQVVANWTRVMGKAAVIGTAAGIVGLFLLFVTFWETRNAARVGARANEIAQEIGERQLRAWLNVRPNLKGPLGRKETWGANIAIVVENIGQTPALNVFVDAKMHLAMPDKPTPQVALDDHVPNAKARSAIEPRVNVLPGEAFVRELPTYVEPSDWDRLWRGFFDEPEVVRAEDPVQFRLFVTVVAVYQTVFSEAQADKVSACAYELRWRSDDNEVSSHPFIDNVKGIPEDQLQLCPSPKSVGVVT